jgi:Protein of unknown function DUF262
MSNNPTSKKLDFLQLLSNDIAIAENESWQPLSKIEIPIIQRDYAQGRDGKEELRKNFLTALLKVVSGKPLELDFVYGSVKNKVLQPLDGQQRLTTLFLLHWFVAVKENKLDDELKKLLTKFTYETRTSSRVFCNELVNKGIDFNKLLETDYYDIEKIKPKNNGLSKSIIDSSWFFLSWKRDPTIKSMLTMLDSIHHTFKDKTEVWDKLNKISFHYIELQNFGLSDDLYIKMNARGKPLTNFENFKAKFEQYVKQNDWEANTEAIETFSHQIDTLWTDLFWSYRDNDNKIDDSILKFISNTAILFYAQSIEIYDDKNEKEDVRKELERKSKNKSITDEAVKRERIERRITKLFNDYSTIQAEDFATKEAFEYLKECLDIYCKDNNDKLNTELLLWDYKSKDSSLFKDLIKVKNSPTYKQRVLFYAQSNYLKNVGSEVTIETFSEWLRVVRNIIENAPLDSATTFMGAINLIKELSNGCSDVYDFLSKNPIQSKFAEEQLKEEIRKAKLIVSNIEIKTILFELEDTLFCKGSINWCLECSDKAVELNKIKRIIDSELNQNNISNWFRRALLTIGNNEFYTYWGSWSYSTNTHKKCLIEDRNELKKHFTKNYGFDNYLKLLIIKLCNNDNNLQSIVNEYTCPDTMPIWKSRLIKESDLLDNFCQEHYIGITDDKKQCYLYRWKKRPASRDECHLVE